MVLARLQHQTFLNFSVKDRKNQFLSLSTCRPPASTLPSIFSPAAHLPQAVAGAAGGSGEGPGELVSQLP